MGKANSGKGSKGEKPIIYYNCFIKYGHWEALISQWPSLFRASEYAEGRLSSIVPGTNQVIQLVGQLKLTMNYKFEIESALRDMVLAVMNSESKKTSPEI